MAVAVVGAAVIRGCGSVDGRMSGFISPETGRMEVKGVAESVASTRSGRPAVTVSLCGDRFSGEKSVVYMQDRSCRSVIRPGDTLVAEVRVKRVENFTEGFDYVANMARKGVFFICFQRGDWSVSPDGSPSFRYRVKRARNRCISALRRSLSPLKPENSALLVAFLAGEKEEVGDELLEDFRRSGLMHTLALSGLHVGIIYSLLAFVFSALGNYPASRKVRSVIVILALWPYAMLTGMGTSIFRAVVMATVYEAAVILERERSPVNTLAVAAVIVTLTDPSAPSTLSFQLSFGAMLGIVIFFRPLSSLISEKWRHGGADGVESIMKTERLPPRCGIPEGEWVKKLSGCRTAADLPGDDEWLTSAGMVVTGLKGMMSRLRKKLWDICALSLSCQLITAPVVWLVFGTFPKWSLLANVLCTPLIGTSMALAPVCMAVRGLPYVGEWGFCLLDRILDLLRFCVGVMGSF